MFVDRAYRADKAFSLTEANDATVVSLCSRLEGVPLHLELVASCVRRSSLAEIDSAGLLGESHTPSPCSAAASIFSSALAISSTMAPSFQSSTSIAIGALA